MHCIKLPLDSGEVGSLARVFLPTLLHDTIHVVWTAVWCIHSVALLYMLCHVLYRLETAGGKKRREEARERGRERGSGEAVEKGECKNRSRRVGGKAKNGETRREAGRKGQE